MGKTQNEKQKRYINKIKSDPQKLKELREKAAKRMRKRRSALAKNANALKQMQEKERVRLREYREKKKNEAKKKAEELEAYKCKQTLGKAMKKAERALPKNLKKKIVVIKALYNKFVEPENAQKNSSTNKC